MPDATPVYPTFSMEKTPDHSGYQIARFVIKDIRKRLFSDQKEMRQYRAWKAERDARLAMEQSNEA